MKLDYQNPTVLIFHINKDVITDSFPSAENDFVDPFRSTIFIGGENDET